jgi:hypothetical protein
MAPQLEASRIIAAACNHLHRDLQGMLGQRVVNNTPVELAAQNLKILIEQQLNDPLNASLSNGVLSARRCLEQQGRFNYPVEVETFLSAQYFQNAWASALKEARALLPEWSKRWQYIRLEDFLGAHQMTYEKLPANLQKKISLAFTERYQTVNGYNKDVWLQAEQDLLSWVLQPALIPNA